MKTKNENLTRTDIACAWLTFAGFALFSSIQRAAYRLTHHTHCAWCKKTMHRAPLGFLSSVHSHGICPTCFDALSAPFNHNSKS